MLIFTINSHHNKFSQHEDQAADKGRQFSPDSPSAQHMGQELRWPVFNERHRIQAMFARSWRREPEEDNASPFLGNSPAAA